MFWFVATPVTVPRMFCEFSGTVTFKCAIPPSYFVIYLLVQHGGNKHTISNGARSSEYNSFECMTFECMTSALRY
jgi:hypothetical protein